MTDAHTKKSIVWFRHDLRLSDNPALSQACANGKVLPIYILDPEDYKNMGTSTKWWLHSSLQTLNDSLDGKLELYKGSSEKIIISLAKKHGVDKVYTNTVYEPEPLKKDKQIAKLLREHNIDYVQSCGQLLWQPSDVTKQDGTPYKVFTAFYRNGCLKAPEPRKPLSAPKKIHTIHDPSNTTKLADFDLLPEKSVAERLEKIWNVGEKAAHTRLKKFLAHGLTGYKNDRNFPAKPGVSRLSPHLHFGEISPNQVWYAAIEEKEHHLKDPDLDCFLSELGWREFSYNLLYNFQDLPEKNFQKKFDNFPWHTNAKLLHAWQQGQTGYPIVDAGMRELAQTGYMHNRVRMIVASFLVKNLLLHWHHGRDWFWEHLVDADLANNSASWQWVAGSGADAAPYFRIFNPITQGEKFDEAGLYTRHFVPELKKLSDKFLFEPWTAPSIILASAGITLGENYPKPIVSVEDSRKKALEAFKKL